MLALSLDRDDQRGQFVAGRMVVGDYDAPGHEQPVGRAGVPGTLAMTGQDHVLDVCSGDAEEVRLHDRMIGPGNNARFRCHEPDLDVGLGWGIGLAMPPGVAGGIGRRAGYRFRPAVAGIVGCLRDRTALMISDGSMPCR